ncbi:MAG: phosphoribosylglycinamide formyltransferase [Bacteroidetes bacterium]|nr:phosphoribosylglycinamide formyltransferase [Bacteroidota bacterium]
MKRLAIFASGEGTNAQHIIDYFRGSKVKISLIVCNNPKANVLNRARQSNIPSFLINKEGFSNENHLLKKLQDEKIDLIICAGFLWKIPDSILHAFPNKIVNIHPALLPKFGGKGMYGLNVHKAVIDAGEKESGITIHFLNEHYDEGEIILQKKCEVEKNETSESLAKKIHQLEHAWYPKTIEQLLKNKS